MSDHKDDQKAKNTPAFNSMTPRVLGSAPKSHIVMLPRSTDPAPTVDGYKSKTKVISGTSKPSKHSKEKSLFDKDRYQDRAAARRQQENEGGEGAVGFDLEEIRQARAVPKTGHDTSIEDYEEDVKSSIYDAIVKYSNLIDPPSNTLEHAPSMWEPGRAILMYDFKNVGPVPQTQFRSESEIKALGLGRPSVQQLATESAIIEAIQKATRPLSNAFVHEQPTTEEFEDMFADDDAPVKDLHEFKHKERMKSTFVRTLEDTSASIPISVQHVIASVVPKTAEYDEDFEKAEVALDDYEECYPGVYEAPGIEFDSDQEETRDPSRPPTVGKKRAAAMEERRTKRKFDKDADRVEKLLNEKFG